MKRMSGFEWYPAPKEYCLHNRKISAVSFVVPWLKIIMKYKANTVANDKKVLDKVMCVV